MTQKVQGEMLEDGSVLDNLSGGVTLVDGNYLRVSNGGTEVEQRTPTQVRTDIGAGTGAGSVTSVDIIGSTGLAVSGGPITTSGSITCTLDTGLQALASFNTSAFLVQTSTNVFAGRTLTGTASRLSITNGTGVAGNPVFDIDAAYVGQTSITTLGTIATGTWNATTIAANRGGTGLSAFTAGNYLNAATTSTLQQRTPAQVLTDIGGQPLDATLTALAGQNWAANAMPLGSGADTMSQLTLGANTIPGRSSAGNVVAKTVSDTAFNALAQAMYGTYTPTITLGTNMASATPNVHTWMRVGNTVTISGHTTADPTAAAGTATDFGVSLPVASNFANAFECAGGGFNGEVPYSPVGVFADVANDRATIVFYSNSTAARTVGYSFTYQVI